MSLPASAGQGTAACSNARTVGRERVQQLQDDALSPLTFNFRESRLQNVPRPGGQVGVPGAQNETHSCNRPVLRGGRPERAGCLTLVLTWLLASTLNKSCHYPYDHNNKPAVFHKKSVAYVTGGQLAAMYPSRCSRILHELRSLPALLEIHAGGRGQRPRQMGPALRIRPHRPRSLCLT